MSYVSHIPKAREPSRSLRIGSLILSSASRTILFNRLPSPTSSSYLHLISSSHNVTQSPTPMSGDTLFLKFDDRNPAFTYGPGWSNLTDVNAYDSTLSYTPNKTNVTIQFYGTFYPQRYTPFVTDQPYRTAPRKCLVAFRCHRKNRRMEPTRFPLHSR